jgi:hypothetical protein
VGAVRELVCKLKNGAELRILVEIKPSVSPSFPDLPPPQRPGFLIEPLTLHVIDTRDVPTEVVLKLAGWKQSRQRTGIAPMTCGQRYPTDGSHGL